MDDLNRYVLLRNVLAGDRESRRVLADLLEEQGERGLAQWAREGRNHKRRQLEFAIIALPVITAIGLGVEFIGAGLEANETFFRKLGVVGYESAPEHQAICRLKQLQQEFSKGSRREAIKAFLLHCASDPALEIYHETPTSGFGPQYILDVTNDLRLALMAFWHDDQQTKSICCERESKRYVRRIVARNHCLLAPSMPATAEAAPSVTMTDWMILRTQATLDKLMQG